MKALSTVALAATSLLAGCEGDPHASEVGYGYVIPSTYSKDAAEYVVRMMDARGVNVAMSFEQAQGAAADAARQARDLFGEATPGLYHYRGDEWVFVPIDDLGPNDLAWVEEQLGFGPLNVENYEVTARAILDKEVTR